MENMETTPHTQKSEPSKDRLTVRLTPSLAEEIRVHCIRKKISYSEFVEELVVRHFDGQPA